MGGGQSAIRDTAGARLVTCSVNRDLIFGPWGFSIDWAWNPASLAGLPFYM